MSKKQELYKQNTISFLRDYVTSIEIGYLQNIPTDEFEDAMNINWHDLKDTETYDPDLAMIQTKMSYELENYVNKRCDELEVYRIDLMKNVGFDYASFYKTIGDLCNELKTVRFMNDRDFVDYFEDVNFDEDA
jgi:hypothetical protein